MPGAFGACELVGGCKTVGSTVTAPRTERSCSKVIPPGRSSIGGWTVRSMIVDSNPTLQSPPSKTAGIFPDRSSSTWRSVVVLGRPERFADGAAMGKSTAARSMRVSGVCGQRTAMVSSPALVCAGMAGLFLRIMVTGPGQKRAASRRALAGISWHQRSRSAVPKT